MKRIPSVLLSLSREMAPNTSGRLICPLNYRLLVALAVPPARPALTHCFFSEHPACPSSIIGKAFGLTIVKNKSSWFAVYTLVWGYQQNTSHPFWESLTVSYSRVEKEPEMVGIGFFRKSFKQLFWSIKKNPFGKIFWDDFVRVHQILVETARSVPFSHTVSNRYFWWFRSLAL